MCEDMADVQPETGCRRIAMRAISRLRLPLFLGCILFAADGALAQPTPIDLGTLGGSVTYPLGINNRGDVVGYSYGDLFPVSAFLWTEKTGMFDLGALERGATAAAVNDRGQVVGTSGANGPRPGLSGSHVFLWTKQDGMVDLHAPPPNGGLNSFAGAINDRGRVIGTYDSGNGFRAFSWTTKEGMIDLGTLGGWRVAPSAVSNKDQVVGRSSLIPAPVPFGEFGQSHAFSWTPTGGLVDLGTLGGPSSGAEAVNEKGDVVGWAEVEEGVSHAFLWTKQDGMVDLGTLGGTFSFAYGVNEAGAIVGYSTLPGDTDEHAFLWTRADGMVDLGTLGGTRSVAYAINERGQVVGRNLTLEPQSIHAFVWTASKGMVDLAPLPGYASSEAFLVNNSGQVVGTSYNRADVYEARPTMWPATH
jgi:probable HAF family extracellular repeat protein